MSRYLCQALGSDEPRFRQALMALERRSGHPNHDLRLSSNIALNVRQKLIELKLDPDDTTAEELYFSLNHKLMTQDRLITKKLRYLAAKHVNAEGNVSDGLMQFVKKLGLPKEGFCLKASVLKRQLKQQAPKKVMHALNYRSVDSMLKLEPMALILLMINSHESEAYLAKFYSKYKKYSAASFEMRPLSILNPKSDKWQRLLGEISSLSGLNIVSSYELGTIILMPINNQPKTGQLSLILADLLNEMSLMVAVSSYLRVQQVSPDFGQKLSSVVMHEPYLDLQLLDHPVSWRSAQKLLYSLEKDLNLPHINLKELAPDKLMDRAAQVLTELKFWLGSDFLALVKAGEVTSLNLNDVARNLAYSLPFSKRELRHLRNNLHRELSKLYLNPDQVIETVLAQPKQKELV